VLEGAIHEFLGRLDTSRAEREFGFKAKMDFGKGLKGTIECIKNI